MNEENQDTYQAKLHKFWHPINIYNGLKSLYFAIIPKGSKVYNITYGFLRLLLKQLHIFNIYYQEWIRRVDTYSQSDFERIQGQINASEHHPHISVIMPVYNPQIQFLEQAIQSVVQQIYPYWELCIADDASTDPRVSKTIQDFAKTDARIRYMIREENGHISAASNSALDLAHHAYIALLDHDDTLHPLALYYVAHTITEHPDCEIIFSDEDKITTRGRRLDPYFKPDFDYDLFLSHNMVSHLGVYKLATVRSVGGFREGLEGSQDYDLALRVLEKCTPDQIIHIPFPLYHWRISKHSVAENVNIKPYAIQAAQRALSEHHIRKNVLAKVSFDPEIVAFNTEYILQEPQPSVEIIVSTPLQAADLDHFLLDLLDNTNYSNYNITLLTQPSVENDQNFAALANNFGSIISLQYAQENQNIAAQLNHHANNATADILVLIKAALSGFFPGWLRLLVGQAIQNGVGAVAPKLLYSTGDVYSTGLILGGPSMINHIYKQESKSEAGYFGWAKVQRGYSALSEKCLVVKRDHFLAVGGFDHEIKEPLLNNVDFCLKCKEKGLRNILNPSVPLIMPGQFKPKTDSMTGQYSADDADLFRFRWQKYLKDDPAFNPNLTIYNENKILVNVAPQLDLPCDHVKKPAR